MIMERKWLVRWMYAAALVHILAGIVLAGSVARLGINVALFGPTIQCVGVLMLALTHFGDARRERSAWLCIAAGLLLWAPQDMLLSLHAAKWLYIWIDVATLALLLPPLLRLHHLDSRAAAALPGAKSAQVDVRQGWCAEKKEPA